MKKLVWIVCLLSPGFVFSQKKVHRTSDQITSLNWDVIGSVKFELTENNELLPVYGATIKRFHHREFDLRGYIIPMKAAKKHQEFLLATLPINQCYFCGKNGVPIMILVKLNHTIDFTNRPVHVKGTLDLANTSASEAPPVALINARVII
ncbi:hypothetical protein [Pedobacter sandarakinus]|uniref:hypothetical protein n=1 Tax=Pedobacter sandarakinus TaxID=353156 RepID=UPI002245D34D|nr:hypothetical protein [Pedobacter sandarakinus]MCX2574429.1 hypothetical protein [Pedobacter sandarakinus]